MLWLSESSFSPLLIKYNRNTPSERNKISAATNQLESTRFDHANSDWIIPRNGLYQPRRLATYVLFSLHKYHSTPLPLSLLSISPLLLYHIFLIQYVSTPTTMTIDASLLFRLILELESHVGIALAGHGINLPIDFFSRSVLEMHPELLIDQSCCTKDFF